MIPKGKTNRLSAQEHSNLINLGLVTCAHNPSIGKEPSVCPQNKWLVGSKIHRDVVWEVYESFANAPYLGVL